MPPRCTDDKTEAQGGYDLTPNGSVLAVGLKEALPSEERQQRGESRETVTGQRWFLGPPRGSWPRGCRHPTSRVPGGLTGEGSASLPALRLPLACRPLGIFLCLRSGVQFHARLQTPESGFNQGLGTEPWSNVWQSSVRPRARHFLSQGLGWWPCGCSTEAPSLGNVCRGRVRGDRCPNQANSLLTSVLAPHPQDRPYLHPSPPTGQGPHPHRARLRPGAEADS